MPNTQAPVTESLSSTVEDRTPDSYESALEELEALVRDMESGKWSLDRMLLAHRRGQVLLAFCQERLQAIEQQVAVVQDGQARPWGAA